MKAFVLIYLISSIVYNVNTFEYYEEYNTEDERSFDYYRTNLGEETLSSYGPVLTTANIPSYIIPNYVPDETNVKISDEFHVAASEIPEITTKAPQDSKKPIYDEKDAPELFRKFIQDFNKQYKDEEEYNKRYQNFIKKLKEINQLNKELDATFDINMFSDLGEGESVIG